MEGWLEERNEVMREGWINGMQQKCMKQKKKKGLKKWLNDWQEKNEVRMEERQEENKGRDEVKEGMCND